MIAYLIKRINKSIIRIDCHIGCYRSSFALCGGRLWRTECEIIQGEKIMEKKILLVDDAAIMRMLIKDALKKNGYTNILEAADGEIACEVYAEEKPDLVIMDITMPNKSGIDALKDIRANDPTAKVIMCSAMGQELIVVDAIRLGALDFIVKPFKADRVLQTVKKFLG